MGVCRGAQQRVKSAARILGRIIECTFWLQQFFLSSVDMTRLYTHRVSTQPHWDTKVRAISSFVKKSQSYSCWAVSMLIGC